MRSQLSKQSSRPADKSITELEDQLRRLKEKQKVYLKLSQKMRDLQERSKLLKRPADDINEQFQDQQIEKLKKEIDRTILDTKKIEEDNKLIRQQMRALQYQLLTLDEVHQGLINENKVKRQRIQLKEEQLLQKQNELQNLTQKRNCNQLVIQQIKSQIAHLQLEQQQLINQLEKIRAQRQQQEKQRQKLRAVFSQLRTQISQKQSSAGDYRAKVVQIRQVSLIVKQQLVTLIHLQQKLHQELQKAVQHYQKAVSQEKDSQNKLKLLQDELKVVEEDIRMLTDQYVRENESLTAEQITNQHLNQEMDQVAKQALQVWQGVKQLLQVGQDNELQIKAYRIWDELSQILSLN